MALLLASHRYLLEGKLLLCGLVICYSDPPALATAQLRPQLELAQTESGRTLLRNDDRVLGTAAALELKVSYAGIFPNLPW